MSQRNRPNHGFQGEQTRQESPPDLEACDDGITAINPMGLPLKELRKLKDMFRDSDGQPIKLTQEQFVQSLSQNRRSSMTATEREQWHLELGALFKKIDASCTQTVDWEEFTDYMLLHMPGIKAAEGAMELAQSGQNSADAFAGAWGCGHMDMINCITVVSDATGGNTVHESGLLAGAVASGSSGSANKSMRRYVTVGRDGFLKVWHPNLQLYRAVDVGSHRSWLSACCWMPKSRRIAVASSRFKIFFYDLTFSSTAISHIDHKEGTPLCLGYTESFESDGREKEILMVGDHAGGVTVYPMDDDWTEQISQSENDSLRFKTKPIRRQYHTDWVTKVGFVQELQAMVTSSLDGDINLCDVHINKRKEDRDAIRLHKKGVHSWCWCRSFKFFASGGLDRQIIIWNPYTQKAMNFLQGHNASILDIKVNEGQSQLISLSVDKVVKVWDIRKNYRCVQTFTDKTEYKPEDRLTCMEFDEDGPALVLCSSTLNVLPVNVKVETSRTHLATIVAALYNDVFHQIVSADYVGTICVWDTRSGKLEFEFRGAHKDHKLTCMTFDESKRRLFTGGEDGVVRLWNFSSGQELRTYTLKQLSEITSILWAKEGPNTFVVGLAWDRRIYVWPMEERQPVEVQNILEDPTRGHTDDVTCLCRWSSAHGLLATGGEDGYIIFWKILENSKAGETRRHRLRDTTSDARRRSRLPSLGGLRSRRSKENPPAHHEAGSGAASPTQPFPPPHARAGSSSAQKRANRRTSIVQAEPPVPAGGSVLSGLSPQPQDHYPEEIGFEDESSETRLAGVEQMIWLEHKECLLTSHSDTQLRTWSPKLYEFLYRLELLKEETSTTLLVPAQVAPITCLYADQSENKWLITGDSEGWIRTWDLSTFRPHHNSRTSPKHVLLRHEFRSHMQAVTHLQHFELDGVVVVMSASADCTIVLQTIDGRRIGNLSSRGHLWRLSEESSWNVGFPSLEELPAKQDTDDGWNVNPRRPVRAQARGNALRSAGHGVTGSTPRGIASVNGPSMRSPRGPAKVETRRGPTSYAPSGHPIFNKLNAVEQFRPNFAIVEQERRWLSEQQPARLQ
mmetsp:Transcript_23156/g.51119  ORF Transcript_23156/g.51119 Transcript_23156/m.51119 type:complete len:1075 (+) Transcript_23156:90-3314(+)